ncbi:MAG: hypothetical protein BKP49_02735 [Treponema sp. CETP13]|nr:MAG: hypothetical protein BKP49_02735 [Treponema sp. CETP13]
MTKKTEIVMPKIKLLCSDIDGTLLNSEHKINIEDKQTIQRAWNEYHIPFALVSGRFRSGVTFIQKELDIPCIYSCFNGNYVEWEGKVINDVPINIQIIKDLIPIIEKAGLVPVVFDKDSYYFSEHTDWYDLQVSVFKTEGHIKPWKQFYTEWEEKKHSVYKILAKDHNPQKIIDFEKQLKLLQYPGIEVVRSSPSILEILPAGTSKASTLSHLSKYFNISTDSIMSFGDFMNDYEMIKDCPHGVAMGNALKELKDVAWYVTKSNDEGGIAHALNKFVFFA